MPNNIVNDGTLVRGSVDLTIGGVLYTLLNYKRPLAGKARTELDYDSSGKPKSASHAEDFETITGTIRMRSDAVQPPKWTTFSYDGKNWYIKEIELSGSTAGLKEYAVDILEQIGAALTIS